VSPSSQVPTNGYGWRWKPLDIVVLLIAFAIYWPVGLIVLAWKLWNDRQPNPQDLGVLLQTGFARLQGLFDTVANGFGGSQTRAAGPFAAASEPPQTGNAAFDAEIREKWARTEAERQRILDEAEAFRAFLAAERSGDRDVYERFRQARNAGRA
jgi:hypothetical protein